MAWTFEESRAGYANLWRSASVKPGADDQNADRFAEKIFANEARYRAVQTATNVPWFFIAALHMRESSCNFDGVLHNGEKIIGTGRLTTLHPPGVGPFATWEESAIHALKSKNLHRVQEWSIERMLYSAEEYNGWGYAGKVNSPYVWAGTNHEQTGKYIRDHVWDAGAEDTQLGVAALLKRMAEKRSDIAAALQSGVGQVVTKPAVIPLEAFIASAFSLYQRSQQPGGLQEQDIRTFLQPLVQGVPSSVPTPPPSAPQPAPSTSAPSTSPWTAADRNGMGLGTLGLIISSVLQYSGVLGTPFEFGEAPSTTGTIATGASIISMLGGMGGGIGMIARLALPLLGRLGGSLSKLSPS